MGKRILITGAGGQLGRALNQVLQKKDSEITIINTGRGEPTSYCPLILDITNSIAVMNVVQDLKPDVIINCAAHTGVDLCETEQEKAYQINAIGPKNLAIAANAIDAKLVHTSTDYVFSGEGTEYYTEDSETDPINVYGKTKLAGEEFVQTHCINYFIIRTAWLYGEGRNFVKTMLNLADKNPEVTVVSDQYGSPTSALELARVIGFLIETDHYGLYHATCEGVASWYDFALYIFKLAGKMVSVKPINTEEYPTPAARPKYSVLENKKLKELEYNMKPWKEALEEYMDNLEK